MPEPILHIPWFLLMVLLPLKQHSGGTHREVYVQCHALTNSSGLFFLFGMFKTTLMPSSLPASGSK